MKQQDLSRWQLLRAFLRQYRLLFLTALGCMLIFWLVFSLYQLESEAIWYAAGLCALVLVPVGCIRFVLFCRRHRQRMQILQHTLRLDRTLPQPATLAEADYQQMIQQLRIDVSQTLTQARQQQEQALDYFTTWVHQIKTPISALHLLLQQEDTPQNLQMQSELFRVEQYVQMVLGYLRLGSDTTDFVFAPAALDAIIRRAVRKYAGQFVQKKIRLEYEPTDAVIVTDEKWLQFILEQLLSNAVKYTQRGSVRICMTPQQILRISDTGIGIAQEDLPRIFEKGFTGYNGRIERKSTGLGLYLCRTAAEKLSISIWAESEPGKGSTFCLNLQQKNLEVE